MQTQLSYKVDGKVYRGFHRLHLNAPPDCKIIVMWMEGNAECWYVDCEGGIGELVRMYREVYDVEPKRTVLVPELAEAWVVSSEFFAEEFNDTISSCFGPFASQTLAESYLNDMRKQETFVGGEVVRLQN